MRCENTLTLAKEQNTSLRLGSVVFANRTSRKGWEFDQNTS